MELKTEGIVLKRFKKGESDDITVIFSREAGKILVSSRSTRKISSKLKFAIELFSLNNYQLEKRNKDSQFFALINAQSLKMFENMRVSLRKIGFSYLVVELLNKFLQLEDKHEDLYGITKELLHIVDAGEYANIENVESFFKLKLLTLSGFDMTGDQAYLKSRRVGGEIKRLIESIESSNSAGGLDTEYSKIREINKVIDSYIIHVLGEDIFSTKFLESMKNAK
jgi:recombinational DNA repair protein (RecF pathway)